VNKVRDALSDTAAHPRYIATVPRQGLPFHRLPVYRADRTQSNPAQDRAAFVPMDRAGAGHRLRSIKWFGGIALIVVTAFAGKLSWDGRAPAVPRSVLILPFRPLQAGDTGAHVALAISEQLTVRMSQLPTLRVRHAVDRGFLALHYVDRHFRQPMDGLYRYREEPNFRFVRDRLARKVMLLRAQY
jgi:hypothetical protein